MLNYLVMIVNTALCGLVAGIIHLYYQSDPLINCIYTPLINDYHGSVHDLLYSLSLQSHHATERGDHRRADYLGNLSIALMLLTVLLGAVLFIFLVAIVIGLAPLFSPCGFSIHKCTWDMFGRELNTLTCLRFPL